MSDKLPDQPLKSAFRKKNASNATGSADLSIADSDSNINNTGRNADHGQQQQHAADQQDQNNSNNAPPPPSHQSDIHENQQHLMMSRGMNGSVYNHDLSLQQVGNSNPFPYSAVAATATAAAAAFPKAASTNTDAYPFAGPAANHLYHHGGGGSAIPPHQRQHHYSTAGAPMSTLVHATQFMMPMEPFAGSAGVERQHQHPQDQATSRGGIPAMMQHHLHTQLMQPITDPLYNQRLRQGFSEQQYCDMFLPPTLQNRSIESNILPASARNPETMAPPSSFAVSSSKLASNPESLAAIFASDDDDTFQDNDESQTNNLTNSGPENASFSSKRSLREGSNDDASPRKQQKLLASNTFIREDEEQFLAKMGLEYVAVEPTEDLAVNQDIPFRKRTVPISSLKKNDVLFSSDEQTIAVDATACVGNRRFRFGITQVIKLYTLASDDQKFRLILQVIASWEAQKPRGQFFVVSSSDAEKCVHLDLESAVQKTKEFLNTHGSNLAPKPETVEITE